MKRQLLLFILALGIFAPSPGDHAHALNCSDIQEVDTRHNYHGALNLYLGCEKPTANTIKPIFNDLPDVFKLTFSFDFYLDGVTDRLLEAPFLENISTFNKIEQAVILIGTEIYESHHADYIEDFVRSTFYGDDELLKLMGALTQAMYPTFDTLEPIEVFKTLRQSQTIPFVAKLLADFYLEGEVIVRNLEKGMALLEQNANKHPWVADTLAEYYRENQFGLAPDQEKYLFYLDQGVKAGWVYAIRSDIEEFWSGEYIAADKEEWVKRTQELALYGDPFAQFNLGYAYKYGDGVKKNLQKAEYWLELAAEIGQDDARAELIDSAVMQWRLDDEVRHQSYLARRGSPLAYIELSKLAYATIPNITKRNLVLSYIRQQCRTNKFVNDNEEDCRFLPGEDRSFVNNIQIDEAISDPGQLRLSSQPPATSESRNYALFFVNENYTNYADLSTPIADGTVLSELLFSKFGYQSIVIKNSDRKEMLEAVYKLKKQLTADDNLILYYGGHGTYDRATGIGYWLPANATVDFPADWISTDEIVNALAHLQARHILLIADACFSGSFAQQAMRGFTTGLGATENSSSRMVMVSGAVEPVRDVGKNPEHSVFAGALIEVIQDLRGPATSEEIFLELKPKILSYAEQTPALIPLIRLGHAGGNLLFEPTISN